MNPSLTLDAPYFGQPSPEGKPQEYRPDRHLLSAARLAYSLRRPLLLTGEPGCGKTDFAWVLADQLGKQHKLQPNERMPFICRVNSQTRAQDLLYHYDALQRLSDAQHGVDPALARDPRNYIELRELGLGLLVGASAVVLIDEIDKAPRDLPNDLLHVVDEGWFRIPELRRVSDESEVKDPHGVPLHHELRPAPSIGRPLIVITSNAERHLPEPFLRRCVFFNVPPPDTDDLRDILRRRLGDGQEALRESQLLIYRALRSEGLGLTKRPSTAELLDWVHALYALPERAKAEATVSAFGAAIHKTTLKLSDSLEWADLPGLPCLIKLEEDMSRLTDRGGQA